MFYIKKRFEISASHRLKLSYQSKCENLHGHNWIITIECKGETLNEDGMLFDFTHIKEIISSRLDHANINDVIKINPTAENMAVWISTFIPNCFRVTVQESEGNEATYEIQG